MDLQNNWCFLDDFWGKGAVQASPAGNDVWAITDTSSAGTPTYVKLDDEPTGAVKLLFDNTNEVQNVCLSFGDILCMDIDLIQGYEVRVKMGQAAVNAATSFAFGLTGDRNDAIDSVAQALLFRVVGGDSTTNVVVESDDGTTDLDDKATGVTLIGAYKRFKIDFSAGTSNVKFYGDDANGNLVRLAKSTTFNMSAYTGCLQPFFQLQKSASTNTDSAIIDYVKVWGKRR